MSLLAVALVGARTADAAAPRHTGKIRTYYIAADEVEWNYTPSDRDEAMDMPFDAIAKSFTQSGPHQIGSLNKKAIYREYTDGTFKTLKLRPSDQGYLGLVGPILHAEVGDTIKVVFKNHATHPYSMHPHGVLYEKDSEGADYNDSTSGAEKSDGCVAPGTTHIYSWHVPDRAGPACAIPAPSSGFTIHIATSCAMLLRDCLVAS